MSITQMKYVFEDTSLKGNEKLLMLALADNANDSGVSFPSWNNLMTKTSMSRNSLSKWLNALEEKQLIFRKQRSRKNGSKTSNKFLIYPLQNKEFLDEEDLLLFEELYTKAPKGELAQYQKANYPQSTKRRTSTVPKGELPKHPKVPKGELLEPSLNTLTITTNHHLSLATNIANYLLNKISTINPSFKKPNIDTWAKDIEKAIRIDGRTEQELISCIDWIYTKDGEFWQKNILSGKKLREKFDTMNMQVITKRKTPANKLDDIYRTGLSATEIIKEMEKRA